MFFRGKPELEKKPRKKKAKARHTLLRTSWNVQAKLFFENSTLHGVRYIAEEGRPFIEKLLWFCCVAIGAVATIVIIASLWEKFQTNPTITGLDTDFHNWDVPFPAITICESIPSNMTTIEDFVRRKMPDAKNPNEIKEFLAKLSLFSYETLEDFKKYTNRGYVADDTDLREYIFELMNSCERIFKDCVWKGDKYNCCQGFFPVFTESGFCYSFNSRHYERKTPWQQQELPPFVMRFIQETDIKWSLKMNFLDDLSDEITFPIYIHNADEVPGIDMQPQHVWDYKVDRISFSVKQTYTTDDTRQLSIRQRKCVFEDEQKLKIDHVYTYTACTRQCRMESAKRYCGCIPFFYPETGSFKHCKIRELACIADHLEAIVNADRCNCQLGCSNTVYEVEKLNEHSAEEVNRALEAEFVSWPMVRYKREVLFGWVDLLVSFGGIAGLFLGFSLLSGVEIIYYFTIRACCMAYREPQKLEALQREETLRPKPNYDLSLVPYFVKEPAPFTGMQEVAKGYFGRNLYLNNKIDPLQIGKKKKGGPRPPFGIEFLN